MKQFRIVLAVCVAFGVLAPLGCEALRDALTGEQTATAYIGITPSQHILDYSHNVEADLKGYKNTFAHLATSDAVLLRALNADIDKDENKLDRIRKTSWFSGNADETVKRLQTELSAVAVKETYVIRLSLRGADPGETANVVNAVADAMVHDAAERVKQPRDKQIKALRVRLDEINTSLASKQKELNQICGPQEPRLIIENRKSMQSALESLPQELTQLRLLKTLAKEALETMKRQAASGRLAPSSLEIQQKLDADPTYQSLLTNLKNLKIELNSLNRLGSHRRTRAIRDRIESLEQVIAEMKKELTEKFIKEVMLKQESQVTAVSERLLAVGNQYNEVLQKSKTLDADLAKISELENEIKRQQARAAQIDAAIVQLRIARDSNPLSVHAYAEIPAKQ